MIKEFLCIISDTLLYWSFKVAPRGSEEREDIGNFILQFADKRKAQYKKYFPK
jgi:hypothetical protein